MKTLLWSVCLVVCASANAQQNACGTPDFKGKVEVNETSNQSSTDSTKATVYFIEDQLVARPGAAHCMHCGVPVLLGVDGEWVGGTQGFTHTNVLIAPGDHHFCARVFLSGEYLPAMYGMHLEAGRTYFLLARLSIAIEAKSNILELSEPNTDQGKYLVSVTKDAKLVQR